MRVTSECYRDRYHHGASAHDNAMIPGHTQIFLFIDNHRNDDYR